MNRYLVASVLSVLASVPAYAQKGAEYRASAGPVYWVSDNPFHLHLVRGGDTVGDPFRAISVFRESWRETSEGFDVIRSSVDLGFSTRAQTDTTTMSRRGKVLRINGKVDYNKGEWDALLRLPDIPLRVGLEWTDTIRHSTDGPRVGFYEVQRLYRVTGRVERGDSAGFEVAAKGRVRFNLSMWTDSAAGRYRWYDLEGPVEEQFVFDPSTGQLYRRTWSMLLKGIGGDHNGTSTDTVPAALNSRNSRYRIPEARAQALMAPMPGSETSATFQATGELLFMHTLERESARQLEGFRRADGMIGRAELNLVASQPISWKFTWVEPGADQRTATYERRDGVLTAGNQPLPSPTLVWGVAEYGMIGSLIPSLQALPEVQDTAFAIYRPSPAKWDRVRVTKRQFPEGTLFVIVTDSGQQSAIVIDGDGLVLYEETVNADGNRATRIPTSEARRTQLERLITAMKGGN